MFAEELSRFTDCNPRQPKGKGHLLSCLVDHKEEMANDQQCSRFLTRMETLVFTDFHLVGPFVKACNDEIVKFECGRLEKDEDAHSQVSTLYPARHRLYMYLCFCIDPICRAKHWNA